MSLILRVPVPSCVLRVPPRTADSHGLRQRREGRFAHARASCHRPVRPEHHRNLSVPRAGMGKYPKWRGPARACHGVFKYPLRRAIAWKVEGNARSDRPQDERDGCAPRSGEERPLDVTQSPRSRERERKSRGCPVCRESEREDSRRSDCPVNWVAWESGLLSERLRRGLPWSTL